MNIQPYAVAQPVGEVCPISCLLYDTAACQVHITAGRARGSCLQDSQVGFKNNGIHLFKLI